MKIKLLLVFLIPSIFACENKMESSHLVLSQNQRGVIYGKNDIQEENSSSQNSLASVAFVQKTDFANLLKGIEPPTVQEQVGLQELAWSQQASLAFCSGVLVKENVILTAGHCVQKIRCEDFVLVSGYTAGAKPQELTAVECQEILDAKSFGSNEDWALVQLKSSLKVKPVLLASEKVPLKTPVYAFGYPLGAPKKRSAGVIRFIQYYGHYETTIDAFSGQSGSPVFDSRTDQLIGILVSGEDDLEDENENLQVRYCQENECLGERVIPIQHIKGL